MSRNPETLKANTDAGTRIHDAVALALVASTDIMEHVGKFMAFKLEDGSTDHVIYDTKDDAVRDKKGRSKDYCYLQITPDGITVKDAMHFLKANRMPWIDTTAPAHVINPTIYPRFSNLTPQQKATAKAAAEAAWKERHK